MSGETGRGPDRGRGRRLRRQATTGLILQDDRFDATDSVTVCPFTTDPIELPMFRLGIAPDAVNGLAERSSLMVRKVATVRRSKLGDRIGRLGDDDMVRLGRAVLVFLGFAGR